MSSVPLVWNTRSFIVYIKYAKTSVGAKLYLDIIVTVSIPATQDPREFPLGTALVIAAIGSINIGAIRTKCTELIGRPGSRVKKPVTC